MTRFLNLLLSVFGWRKRKIEPYDEIQNNENVARYLFHRKKQYNENAPPTASRVKHAAFALGENSSVSVYRTENLSETEILSIGDTYVASLAKKKIKAWAVLKAETILHNELAIEPDGIPHPRHANITKWPNDQPKIKMLQLILANEAELFTRN